MNTRKIASLATVAAIAAAASATASAGELYGGLDNRLIAGSTKSMTASFETPLASSGALYAEIDTTPAPLSDNFAVAMAPETGLSVGGELGYPQDSARRVIGGAYQATAVAE